jgi:hypothetical protein
MTLVLQYAKISLFNFLFYIGIMFAFRLSNHISLIFFKEIIKLFL